MNDGEQLMFAARESAQLGAGSADGLTWPVVVMRAGFARGEVMTGDPQLAGLPHYFPRDVVAQVAQAAKDARFGATIRRRKPKKPTRRGSRAGWTRERCRATKPAPRCTYTKTKKICRRKLLAARRAGSLASLGAHRSSHVSHGTKAWPKGDLLLWRRDSRA